MCFQAPTFPKRVIYIITNASLASGGFLHEQSQGQDTEKSEANEDCLIHLQTSLRSNRRQENSENKYHQLVAFQGTKQFFD